MENADPAIAKQFLEALGVFEAGDYEAGLQAMAHLVEANPAAADARYYFGEMLSRIGRYAQAETVLRDAVALQPAPELRLGLAFSLMGQGRYPEGWALYGARHEISSANLPTPKAFPYPEWRGEPLAGKHLVIFPEQGFGDQIQFARFIPQLQARGAEVTLLCRPGLERLFAHSFPDVRVLAAAGALEFPDPDYWVMAGGLAGPVGARLETLPTSPYLRTPATWPPLGEGLKVGLVTEGSPTQANDKYRSLPAEMSQRLEAMLPGQVIRLDPKYSGAKDFADTAALIERLDLVVSVDTSVAHLAGAMGKACWVLLPYLNTDWRWPRGRDVSDWYPSMRTFRQAPDRDWVPVFDRVVDELKVQYAA